MINNIMIDNLTCAEVCQCLEKHNNNIKKTAEDLGLEYKRLYIKMRTARWASFFGYEDSDLKCSDTRSGGQMQQIKIECMEKCGRKALVLVPADEGVPRGFRKRCAICNTAAGEITGGYLPNY